MKVGEIIEVWEAEAEVKEAWEKEGHQFFISEDEDGWLTTIGVLCGKKNKISYEIIEEIGNDIHSFLELLPTTVIAGEEKHIAWAIDITDCSEEEIKEIKEELKRVIKVFDREMEKNKEIVLERKKDEKIKKILLSVAGLIGGLLSVGTGLYIWIKLLPELTTPIGQVTKGILAAFFIGLGILIILLSPDPRKG